VTDVRGFGEFGWPQAPAPRHRHSTQRKAEPRATWSLVLGILSFVVLPVVGGVAAIITAIAAKHAIDSSHGASTGRRRAEVAEVLGIANVVIAPVVIILVAVLSSGPGNHVNYTKLQAGSCYDKISGGGASVDKANCAQPHETEVTGTFQADDPGHFPGADGLRSQTVPTCSTEARRYLGSRSPTGLHIVWLVPTQSLWDSGGRTVVCGLQNADGTERTGSLRG
jgi:hypothetical protein